MPACKTCGESITWTEPEKGKWVPVEGDGLRHRCQAKARPGPVRTIHAVEPGSYVPPSSFGQPMPTNGTLPYNTPARREPDQELAHQLNRVADALDRTSVLLREFLEEMRK